MPSLDVTKPGQVVTDNFSLFSLEQYPEILKLCAFSWSYRVYLAFCRTTSHNQRLATHHPRGTHDIGDVVTGRVGKHPQHFQCPWASWRNLQEDVPTGSWAGFMVGVSKVVSQSDLWSFDDFWALVAVSPHISYLLPASLDHFAVLIISGF